MDNEETRDTLIVEAKSYGVPEALLDRLNIASLRKIVEYEQEARDRSDASEKI